MSESKNVCRFCLNSNCERYCELHQWVIDKRVDTRHCANFDPNSKYLRGKNEN